MTKTLQQQYIEALQKRGETEVKRLHNCIVYTASAHAAQTSKKYFYVGVSGSLRIGNDRASSVPVSKYFKHKLLEQAQ